MTRDSGKPVDYETPARGAGDGLCGVLLIDKPEDMTSHDAVARVRRLFGTRSVGHTGTLDPMATGLLCVLVGRAVKASEFFTDGDKRYTALMRLGVTSDTEDIWGNITPVPGELPDGFAVRAAAARFTGRVSQIPPMYSALKRDGHKLCDLARRGITVEREARDVFIYGLDVADTDRPDEYRLEIRCSKGTYVRTLCADIGRAAGSGALMSGLRRTAVCGLDICHAHTFEEIEKAPFSARAAMLAPVENAFPALERVVLDDFFARLALCGNEIYQKKAGTAHPDGTLVLLYDKNGFFAFARARSFPDGSALKPVKQIRQG